MRHIPTRSGCSSTYASSSRYVRCRCSFTTDIATAAASRRGLRWPLARRRAALWMERRIPLHAFSIRFVLAS